MLEWGGIFPTVCKWVYFAKLQQKHFLKKKKKYESHDQQLDVTTGGNLEKEDDKKSLEDVGGHVFNNLSCDKTYSRVI